MKQLFIRTLLASFILLLFTGTQCNKDTVPQPLSHDFTEKITLAPYKKTYSLNDTLWIEYQSNNKSLYDKLSNSRINYDTTYVNAQFFYRCLYTKDSALLCCLPVVANAAPASFSGTPTTGTYLFLSTRCTAGNFFFRVGFVPTKKGYFLLQPGAAVLACNDKKLLQYTSMAWTFDLADCNKDVFQASPQQSSSSEKASIEEGLDKKGFFAFKVE